MTEQRPVYALSPETPDASLRDLLPGRELTYLTTAAELHGLAPGVLLLPIELPPDQLVAALNHIAAATTEGPWLLLMVERFADGAHSRAIPLSVGWPTPAEQVARWAAGDRDADVLELRHVLARVARGRHDINNPLTSAMAETQLALMDATDPVIRASLETLEEQLRRIRDLVASLRSLSPRPWRRPVPRVSQTAKREACILQGPPISVKQMTYLRWGVSRVQLKLR